MTPFGSYTRDQLRQSYVQAWRKRCDGALQSPLEALIADVIELHPEYHPAVDDVGSALALESSAGTGTENPFLHMGLHLAVREQVSIDRPPGVRALHQQLQRRCREVHAAEHILMESLAETLWEAQRSGREPDEAHYLDLARRRLATFAPP